VKSSGCKVWLKQSYRLLITVLVVTVLGCATKFYCGPAQIWVNNSLGGVFYEIFWCLLAGLFCTRHDAAKIAINVLLITIVLEFLQLWHPPFLEILRRTCIGRTVLGNSFNWTDFSYYFIGSLLGYLGLRALAPVSRSGKDR
jgi:hypothetical protein